VPSDKEVARMEKDKQEYLNSEYYKKIKEIFEGVEVVDGYDK